MKKFGFTLAEILVALAIVGVVAAISIPTMVTESNKKIWANSLAVAVSNFENAITTYVLTEGATDLYGTESFRDDYKTEFLKDVSSERLTLTSSNASLFQYYPIDNKTKGIKALSPKNTTFNTNSLSFMIGADVGNLIWEANNGVSYMLYGKKEYDQSDDVEDAKLSYLAASVMIDVNGQKGPNRLGRDIFFFVVDKSGHLYPYNGKEHTEYMKKKGEIISSIHGFLKEVLSACDPKIKGSFWSDPIPRNGETCAARVVENGFKMDY